MNHARLRIALAALAVSVACAPPAARAQTPAYSVLDLGSLTAEGGSLAAAVSGSGQVAGYASVYDPDGFFQGNAAFLWQHGALTSLSPGRASLAGSGFPVAVNAAAQVLSSHALFDAIGNPLGVTPYLWQDGANSRVNGFGTDKAGATHSTAVGLNSAGQIAGTASFYDDRHNSLGQSAFFWSGGVLTRIPYLSVNSKGRGFAVASGLNDAGQVAGVSTAYDAHGSVLGNHLFLWSGGKTRDLFPADADPTLSIDTDQPVAVNGAGQVIGNATLSTTGGDGVAKTHVALLCKNGALLDLGTLGADRGGHGFSVAVALNDAGQVIGDSEVYDAANRYLGRHSFLWQNDTRTDLGSFGTNASGASYNDTLYLNYAGQVVGTSVTYDAAHHQTGNDYFLWQGGRLTNLSALLRGAGWSYAQITGLSDTGEVSGFGAFRDATHAFLLRPAGAPAATAVSLAAGANGTRILWSTVSGATNIWNVSAAGGGGASPTFGPYSGAGTQAVAAAPDGSTRLLWTNGGGQAAVWNVRANGTYVSSLSFGPYKDAGVRSLAVGADGKTRLLWTTTDGKASVWTLGADGAFLSSSPSLGPVSGLHAKDVAVGADGLARLLWVNVSGAASVWTVAANGTVTKSISLGPFAGWTATNVLVGASNSLRLVWTNTDGHAAVTTLAAGQNPQTGTRYGRSVGWRVWHGAVGPDNNVHLLWTKTNGQACLWTIAPDGTVLAKTGDYGPY